MKLFPANADPMSHSHKQMRFAAVCVCVVTAVDCGIVVAFLRHKKIELLRRMSVKEDGCQVCFDNHADVVLHPCSHRYKRTLRLPGIPSIWV